MRIRSFLVVLALGAAGGVVYSACGGGGGGDGGSVGAEGDVCDSSSPCNSGLICKTYLGVGADGGTIQICRQTCQGASDCNATVKTNSCSGTGVCACAPSTTADPCTAVNPNTICHPDYDYCVTVGGGACQPGEAAVTYNSQTICRPDGSATSGTDGGTGCSGTDVPSTCLWPNFCGGPSGCTPAQNMTATGTDQSSSACDFNSGGGGNADSLRQTPVGQNGPIIMTMSQDTITATDCTSATLGTDMSVNTNDNHLCDGDGLQQCGAQETVVLFQGAVYDPSAGFATAAGSALDSQFYRVVEGGTSPGTGTNLTVASSGAGYSGHVLPQAGWSAKGGSFVLLRCFGAGDQTLSQSVVPAHYGQTTGNPGNTFCSIWN